MRSGEAWPVVYGFYENSLNAYSLFPVINPNVKPHVGPNTNWHQIGSNLAGSQFPLSGPYYLQAASGSPEIGRNLFNTNCSHCHGPDAASPDARIDLRRPAA